MLIIGLPAAPEFGNLTPGPNVGEITVEIKTMTSGIDTNFQVFGFIITPILDGVSRESMLHLITNYKSGQFETVVISGLMAERSYVLNATATNLFGSSEAVISNSIEVLRLASTSQYHNEGTYIYNILELLISIITNIILLFASLTETIMLTYYNILFSYCSRPTILNSFQWPSDWRSGSMCLYCIVMHPSTYCSDSRSIIYTKR